MPESGTSGSREPGLVIVTCTSGMSVVAKVRRRVGRAALPSRVESVLM